MSEAKPPLSAELTWLEGLRFDAVSGASAIVVDGNGAAGPSPVQLAAFGLAGCMAADVVAILRKGRHPFRGLQASLTAERAPEPPRRFLRIGIRFRVRGVVPYEAVERAIELSRERYCSVWHSLRQDIELTTSIELLP